MVHGVDHPAQSSNAVPSASHTTGIPFVSSTSTRSSFIDCKTLRLHLSNVAKYAHQAHSIDLSDLEVLQHHLDMRFVQLNTSVELELWQEALSKTSIISSR